MTNKELDDFLYRCAVGLVVTTAAITFAGVVYLGLKLWEYL